MFPTHLSAAFTLLLTASPALAASSTAGSLPPTPPPAFTLGIAAASTVNDRPAAAISSVHGISGAPATALAANDAVQGGADRVPIRPSTR
jgi:hypothetical protein